MKRKIKITFNAPVVLGFAAICFIATLLNYNVAKQKEYILDIDLDFLNSENDFVKYRDIIINLIKGTDIITIAREHSYFNFLRDNIEWTNDIALQKILNLLEVI